MKFWDKVQMGPQFAQDKDTYRLNGCRKAAHDGLSFFRRDVARGALIEVETDPIRAQLGRLQGVPFIRDAANFHSQTIAHALQSTAPEKRRHPQFPSRLFSAFLRALCG